MPSFRFDRSTLPAQPWKNGGGVTREVVCLPEGSDVDRFDWRVSIAQIARAGPFSAFAGYERVITLLEGSGVRLRSADGAIDHRLDTPLEPFRFPGEAVIQADLLGEACSDLNVMTRRAACSARVQVARNTCALPRCRQGLLLAMRGQWDLQGEAQQPLVAGQGLWWHDAGVAWQLRTQDPDPALMAVLIDPVLS